MADGRWVATCCPQCPAMMTPDVVGVVATVGDAPVAAAAPAHAAGQKKVAWLDELVDVAAAAAGPVASKAATTADCLEEDVGSGLDELPDAKATTGEDAVG